MSKDGSKGRGIPNSVKVHVAYFWTILRWTIYALVIGSICGWIGIGFDRYLELAVEGFEHFPWIVLGLPAVGLLIVALYRRCRVEKDNGFEMILESIKTNSRVPYLCAPLVFLCTGLTHLFGGSSGREGAALQIGGTVGTVFGRILHISEKETNILALCGMSALFSAVFRTPITAAVLAIEIVSIDGLYYTAFFPCVGAAIVADLQADFCGIASTAELIPDVLLPTVSVGTLLRVLILALLLSALILIYLSAIKYARIFSEKIFKNPYHRIAVGGGLLAVLTLVFRFVTGGFDYNGAGMALAVQAVNGSARPEAFLVKILFTALTLGCGFKGGKIVPSFCIGATFGCTVAPLLGLDPSFAAMLGMIALFSGMDNCPLAAILLAVELFGGSVGASGMVYVVLVCAACYMLTGYFILYSGRETVYNSLIRDYVYQPRSFPSSKERSGGRSSEDRSSASSDAPSHRGLSALDGRGPQVPPISTSEEPDSRGGDRDEL